MRIYIDDESSRQLDEKAGRRDKSPEDTLKEAVDRLDDGEAEDLPEEDAGAADVPKTG
ncbi:hypothetical protein [Tianweitania sediminis]|jgi:hypothetical protein|uniref:Uncharacterized protein n=1 Tax=Tianweitania sediminis TaxID=1502156 RepID=A0A8J7R8F3_9HYPH|nr:hypothetical protein [Tianweitania sediminis]MBP0440127.1 hypothetical protein [Tianweitania sediminis]HEV7417263.1 hypothetical protein [Tianweitania sediminis]